MARRYALGSIGAGNMAEGIIAAVVAEKIYAPEAIIVSDPVEERRKLLADQFGVAVTDDNRQLATESERIMLAVKPQSFAEVAAELGDAVGSDHLAISIMAGMSTYKIAVAFGAAAPRVVRVMPNLPIRVGAGMAGIFAGASATEADVADVRAIFDAGGETIVLTDEALMDVVTAIAGSGPAYFYYFVEAMVAGGKASGLSEDDALKMARQTCLGAARMMLESDEPPAELRRKVTSKGGTTQAALDHMNTIGVGNSIRDAVRAAFRRGQELGS